jgi:hypothetical protein
VHRLCAIRLPPALPPRRRAGSQRRQFAFKARGSGVRGQGLGNQPIAAQTLVGRPFFSLRQQGSKVVDASFKRCYRSGVVRPFAGRRLILLSIHVEQNAGLAVIARLSTRPDRARSNGFWLRSERRSGLSRSGPYGLAIPNFFLAESITH